MFAGAARKCRTRPWSAPGTFGMPYGGPGVPGETAGALAQLGPSTSCRTLLRMVAVRSGGSASMQSCSMAMA